MVQVKQSSTLRFMPLSEAMQQPVILDTGADSPKALRTLHACFCCADAALRGDDSGDEGEGDSDTSIGPSGCRASSSVAECPPVTMQSSMRLLLTASWCVYAKKSG